MDVTYEDLIREAQNRLGEMEVELIALKVMNKKLESRIVELGADECTCSPTEDEACTSSKCVGGSKLPASP